MTRLEPWPLLNTTKLHQPGMTANLVVRPRLGEQMNRGVVAPLTLVCASAGYGKTTLVSSWLQNRKAGDWPAAWLSLDEYDSDLTVFLRYFCAALATIFPGPCTQTLALLQAPQQAPPDVVIATLSSEIQALPQNFILVLDDYHTISGVEVPNLFAGLARHWPRPLHVVMTTRHNPPLPLARMRGKGQLSEIRTRDLRFTAEETAQYLTCVRGEPPSAPVLAQLEQQIEGWIAGLHLATLSLPKDVDTATLTVLAETDSNITEYLLDELLQQLPPDVLTFLLQTALLNRFCVPLCEQVVARDASERSARECLDWLERTNFLIVPLDDRQEWYRYHHLLQDLLRGQVAGVLGPARVSALHRSAAAWFVQQGLIEEALQQALAGSDLDQAAALMEQSLPDVLDREDMATLRHWLSLLPEDFRNRRPGLLLIEAWVLHFSWRIRELVGVLQKIEMLVAEGAGALGAGQAKILRGQVLFMRGQAAFFGNQAARSIPYLQEALALLPPSHTFARGACIFILGLSGQAAGQGDAVDQFLWATYAAAPDKSDAYALRVLGALCFTEIQAGQLEKARQSGTLALQQARHRSTFLTTGWVHYWLGLIHYEWNELPAAAQHFEGVTRQRYSLHSLPAREGLLGMLRVQIAAGHLAGAQETLELLSQYDVDMLGYETAAAQAARAELRYLQGDMVGAGRWVDAFNEPVPEQPLLSTHSAHIIRARLLLARGAAADVQAAQAIIAALLPIAAGTYNTRFTIALRALRALALDAEGQGRAAQTSLREALELAQPGGFIRTFVDLGPTMQAQLERLARQGSAPAHLHCVLAAFPALAQSGTQPRSSAIPTLGGEPLTTRELDVLTLLRERLSAKEIARQLGIAPMTVNRHSANLYDKLGVRTRWDAVARAEELGILPRR